MINPIKSIELINLINPINCLIQLIRIIRLIPFIELIGFIESIGFFELIKSIDWQIILLVEFDYCYCRFNQIFGNRLRALIAPLHYFTILKRCLLQETVRGREILNT